MKTYSIGTQYSTHGKYPVICTVTDILRTYNSKDELIKVRYVATHQLMDLTITDYDVVGVTIARGVIVEATNDEAIAKAEGNL